MILPIKRGRPVASVSSKAGTGGDEQRYRAPALDKGLDILELISRATEPMSIGMITQALGRSTGELFRMIQVLEYLSLIHI